MAHSDSTNNSTASSDDVHVDESDKFNTWLYNALMKEETPSKLVKLCRQRDRYPEGPLHVLTLHDDTVLHMAAHTAKADFVNQLLEMLPVNEYCELTRQNAVGNTILHEAVAFDKLVPAAKRMLDMAPELSSMANKFGERPLFSAARYGQIEMFKFLDMKIESEAERKKFYQKDNRDTVLHSAVFFGHFDLAYLIATAEQSKYLVVEKDEHGMTALQHLATNSAAFEMRKTEGSLKCCIYNGLLKVENLIPSPAMRGKGNKDAWIWRVPLWGAIRMKMVKYESAKKLASFLVAKDNSSWKKTYPLEAQPSETKQNGGLSISSSASNITAEIDGEKDNRDTPLFLAIKAGCKDIVENILQMYPQAAEHVDGKGCTVLHIAVKHRRVWVFYVLQKMGIPWRRLIEYRDKDLNTILHMVGQDCVFEVALGNPVLQLQYDSLLFEHVKEICSSCSVDLSLYRNREEKTAREVFVEKKEELRRKAVEELKFITESSSWLGAFIATVAFAAVLTVPGGLQQETGIPVFLNHPFFLIFTIADILCLTCISISLVLFFSVLVSSFRFKDFKLSIPGRVALGITFLMLGVSMLALAFAASIVLMVQTKNMWTKIGIYTILFLPFAVLSATIVPNLLILERVFMSSIYITDVTGPARPLYTGISFPVKHLLRFGRSITPPPSKSTKVKETTPV